MVAVEPIPGAPAATTSIGGKQALVIADYHAGIEAALSYERGVELQSQAEARRSQLTNLIDQTGATRLIILGDLMHSIGGPGGAERGEVEVLIESLPEQVSVTLIKGNHDGDIESWVPEVSVTPGNGTVLDDLGLVHGHSWPARAVLEAEVVCVGHEHPCVRLEDTVGGTKVERVWLRGPADREIFGDRHEDLDWQDPEIIVFPAFNQVVGGTWINVDEQDFLAPFLPEALTRGEAFLLDGTRLGDYRQI